MDIHNLLLTRALFLAICSLRLEAREPWLEPFHEESIWNHPIGSDAVLVHAGLTSQPNLDVDKEYLFTTTWDDPVHEISSPSAWHQRWPGKPAPWQGKMHVPADFILADAIGTQTPNNPSAFLMPDRATLVQLAPTTRVDPTSAIVGYRSLNVFLYGSGEIGSHTGSNLSGLGGSIRRHEWGPEKELHHAVKINVQAEKFLSYDDEFKGFRWPATTADNYASEVYGGTHSETRMGALVTFPCGTTYQSIGGLETWQAQKFFDAIYRYGAYIVEDTVWDCHAICAEAGVDIPIANAQFRAEINRIFEHLHVVTNNTPDNPGGGGELRAPKRPPLGPPLRAQISLQARANQQFVSALEGGEEPLLAGRKQVGQWETFEVVDAGEGLIALRSMANRLFVTVASPGEILIANRHEIGEWEKFSWESQDRQQSIALKSQKNGKYVSAESGGEDSLRANREHASSWEKFIPGGGAGVWTGHGSHRYFGIPGQ